MKKYILTAILSAVSFGLITNLSFAQVVGDVDPGMTGTSVTNACTNLAYNLRLGARDANTNGEVTSLQEFLVSEELLSVDPTGYFGNATYRAVKVFQSNNGLLNSGYVGPLTRAAIKNVSCNGGVSSAVKGTYRGYLNGVLFITTPDLSRTEAVTNCMTNKNNNPGSSIRCTWEGTEIYAYTVNSNVLPTCSITTDKSSYTFGESVHVFYTSTNANYATWVPDTSGKDNFVLGGDKLTPSGNTTLSANIIGNPFVTLLVSNEAGSNTCTKVIPVSYSSAAPTITLSPSATTTGYGGTVNITWSVTPSTGVTCVAAGGNLASGTTIGTTGSWTTPPLYTNTQYGMRCTNNSNGLLSYKYSTVTVTPITQSPLNASSSLYNFGAGDRESCNGLIINRFGSAVATCSIGGGCGVVCGKPGTNCPSANPATWGACVDPSLLVAPTITLSPSATTTGYGGTVNITWSVTPSTGVTCVAAGGNLASGTTIGTTGSWTTPPLYTNTQYGMRCTNNSNGLASYKYANVNITTSQQSPSATVRLSPDPANIAVDGVFTATWSGTNAPTSYNVKINDRILQQGTVTSWSGTPASLGLSAGTYNVSAQACNTAGCGTWSSPVILRVSSPATSVPVSSLTIDKASVPINETFTANWPGTNTPTRYRLTVDGAIKEMGTAAGWSGTPEAIGFTAGTHVIYAQACNNVGCGSWSSPITFTVTASTVSIPTASLRLDKSSVDAGGTITATWSGTNAPTAYSINIDSRVYLSDVTSTSWSGTVASLGLTPGQHTVSVKACNRGGCSGWSQQSLLVTSTTEPYQVPSDPVLSISPSSVDSSGTFSASWPSTGMQISYIIYADGNVRLTDITNTSWSGTPASLGLAPGQHTFGVKACNSKGCSGLVQRSLTVSSVQPPVSSITINPAAPSYVAPTETFAVSWSGTNSPTSYRLTVDGAIKEMGTATSWSGTPAALGFGAGQHVVYAQACNSAGCGAWSVPATLSVTAVTTNTTTVTPQVPIVSVAITPSSVASSGEFTATWSSATSDVTSYKIKIDGGNSLDVGLVARWTGTPASLGLATGQHLIYVQGCNSAGCGAWSTPAVLAVTAPVSFNPNLATAVLGISTQCVDLPYNMYRGYESYAVTKLQEFLRSRNFLGETTGFYGDQTVAAVSEYQKSRGLPQTGMVYDFTRQTIKGETCQ